MILRITFILLSVSGYCLSAWSQAPGFTGKRFLLRAEGYAFPSLRFIYTDDRSFTLHTHAGISTEYVLDRRFSTGLLLSSIRTQTAYNYQNRTGRASIRSINMGAFLKAYTFLRRGNIAPIGPYQKLELQYLSYQMTDLDQAFFPDGRQALGAYHDWVFTYTIGSQHVLPPRLTYHWGIQGGWVLNVGQVFPFSEPNKYLSDISISQLRDQFALNIILGIGILLF